MKKNPSSIVFIVVPILVVVFIAATLHEMKYFYYGWFDPVYAYLMNGLTFAKGSLDIGHTDHPGTPLQLLSALIIIIVGFVRGTDDLATDVIAHPELYSAVISYVLVLINATVLYFLGAKVYKATQNKWLALLIQVVPLLSFDAVHFMPIIATESILVFSTLLLALLMMIYAWPTNKEQHYSIFWFAFLSGVILSTKISALPVLAVPFFFIKGTKRKLQYGLFTLFFAFLFVLPILPKLKNFFHFIGAIFTHTGAYGSGEEKLIDWSIYAASLRDLFIRDIPFTLHILLLLAGWGWIAGKKNVAPVLKRIWLGLSAATLIGVIVVARHYSFHYLLPVYVIVMPLQVYFWYSLSEKWLNQHNCERYAWIVWLIIPLVFVRLVVLFHFYPNIKTPVADTVANIESHYHGTYIIFNHSSRGGAFPEPALRFGLTYTGSGVKEGYRKIMDENYPDNYLWSSRDGLSNWNGNVMVADLFSRNDSLYLYNRSVNCKESYKEISEMLEQNGLSGLTTIREVYQNKLSNEVIVVAHNDTSAIKKMLVPTEVILADMENRTLDKEHFLTEDGDHSFEGGKLQTNTEIGRAHV